MQRFHAAMKGPFPEVNEPVVEGVRLPAGHLVIADPSYARGEPLRDPVLWISDDALPAVGDTWCALAARFSEHGLWPLLLQPLERDDTRPWDDGELDPTGMSDPGSHDAATVLANALPRAESPFPGLAAAGSGGGRPIEAEVRRTQNVRLGLVATTRPADSPAVLGWMGPTNHENDTGKLSAVMRSWEDRFGAYLIGLGFAEMSLVVERPPATIEHATAIAEEHYRFCPDNIWQGAGTIDRYAPRLVGASVWHFWWD